MAECRQGHPIPDGASFCAACGARVGPPPRWRRAVVVAAVVLVALLGGVVIGALVQRDRETSSAGAVTTTETTSTTARLATTSSSTSSTATTIAPATTSTLPPTTVAPPTTADPWAMAGFRASDIESPLNGTVRVFSYRPNYINGFPITMNGCATRAMRTHWRSLGTPVTVGVVFFSDTPESATESDATELRTASSGWVDTGGCEQPVFFVQDAAGPGDTLVDVAYEVRVYNAAP